jgi:hypothetical protein
MEVEKLTVEAFTEALAQSMSGCGEIGSMVVAIEVDPLDTDVGTIAGCLQAVLDIEAAKRPRVVVLTFNDPTLRGGAPLFKSSAVRTWAKQFVNARGVFDTARALSDDRSLAMSASRFPFPPLVAASCVGCGRAKLLALAGYHDGLEVADNGVPTWSLDKAAEVILETWATHDNAEVQGSEPDAGALS